MGSIGLLWDRLFTIPVDGAKQFATGSIGLLWDRLFTCPALHSYLGILV